MPSPEARCSDRVTGARLLLLVLVASTYDETANGVAGLLILGVDWLRHQQLAALTWTRLKRAYSLPLEVARNLQQSYYVAIGDTELHRQELVMVTQALNAQGIEPVLFKGAALAFNVYPEAACRLMGDIDIWLTADEMFRAQKTLESIGYIPVETAKRPFQMMMQNSGQVQMKGSRPGQGLVEFHWGVFPGEWLQRTTCVDNSGIRRRIAVVTIVKQSAFVLSCEDGLLQIAVHTAITHQFSMSALRSLVDVTLLARHQPLDWSAIVQRAHEWRVATATWLVLRLAVDLCGLNEAADAAQQLAPAGVRQKLIGLFVNAQALVDMRDLSKSRWRYVYLLLMVDRKRDAVKLIYRALWPENEWLQARYGRSGWRIRLRHLIDAARGRI